jgi:mannose-6-phosphate isomerase-like protein (cupin superfamily)
MKEAVKQQDLSNEFYTPERAYITELSNTPDDPNASIARARVAPGVTTRWHRLIGTTERYYIVAGRGRVEVGKCRQRITNIGSEDLIFLAICTPKFSDDVYEDIEDNFSQNAPS